MMRGRAAWTRGGALRRSLWARPRAGTTSSRCVWPCWCVDGWLCAACVCGWLCRAVPVARRAACAPACVHACVRPSAHTQPAAWPSPIAGRQAGRQAFRQACVCARACTRMSAHGPTIRTPPAPARRTWRP